MWYLCYFLHRHLDYRIAEVEALAALAGCPAPKWRLPAGDLAHSPFYHIELPSDDVARSIAQRSVLVKGMYDVWGEGADYDELHASLQACPSERMEPFLAADASFKIVVDGFGKVIPMEDQFERIERFGYIPFLGRVDLRRPDHKFWLIEVAADGNNGLPVLPPRVFFARQVACSDRSIIARYELRSRPYLGPTAMDAEMAFLMANQALACAGALVFDPFVGTGSILVAAAHYGAMTMGADIDIRVVRDGKGPGRNVWANFRQYGLPAPLGLMRADNNCPPWREELGEIFDAVICDPPYGVRAGGRKSGGRKLLRGTKEPYVIPDDMREDHIPSTAPYTLEECLHDLLDMAARCLKPGGRLVFFFPAARELYSDGGLPAHPCFRVVANSEQILTRRWSRRLLTMVKERAYTADMRARARARHEEFRKEHVGLLRDAHKTDLHEIVFAPSVPSRVHREASIRGMSDSSADSDSALAGLTLDARPGYRAKNV